jgi:hypothetical protein
MPAIAPFGSALDAEAGDATGAFVVEGTIAAAVDVGDEMVEDSEMARARALIAAAWSDRTILDGGGPCQSEGYKLPLADFINALNWMEDVVSMVSGDLATQFD